MNKLSLFLVLSLLLAGCGIFSKEYTPGYAFEGQDEMIQFLEENDWSFELQSLHGPLVPPLFNTYGYGFEIKGDTIKSYLPYFGESYGAPDFGSRESPLTFKAPLVSYSVTDGTHIGEADIEIVMRKDPHHTIAFQIVAFTNGSATVVMRSTELESLTYRGIITRPDQKR